MSGSERAQGGQGERRGNRTPKPTTTKVDLSKEGPGGPTTAPTIVRDLHLEHNYVPLFQGENAPFDIRFASLYHRTQDNPGTSVHFPWAAALAHSEALREEYGAHVTEYRAAMRDIFQLLDVTKPDEINRAFTNPGTTTSADANRAVGKIYSAEGNRRRVKESRRAKTVADFAASADSLISRLRLGDELGDGVLNPIAWKIRPSEEPLSRSNPLELLELVYRPGNQKKLGFEALRKLFLMSKVAAVDAVAHNLEEGETYREFTDLLDKLVWDQDHPKGYTEDTILLSRHDPETYEVLYELADGSLVAFDKIPDDQIHLARPAITEIPESEKDSVTARVKAQNPDQEGHHVRLTTLQSRLFKQDGITSHAFVDKRIKPFHSWVMKMLRKGEDEPTVAVEDKIGMMVVVKDIKEVDRLMEAFQLAGRRTGSILLPEGIEDNLKRRGKRKKYSAKNTGSSDKTEMLKFYARVHGMRIEVIVHTYESYLNYKFSDTTGHKAFEIRRFFESGLFRLFFPKSIYHEVDEDADKEYLLETDRRDKRQNRIA